MEILGIIVNTLVNQSPWEWLAVVLSVLYLTLAMKQIRWCWLAGGLSTAIYSVIFWDVSLVMDASLNVYYIAMAVYGWWHWNAKGEAREIVCWTSRQHGLAMVLIAISTFLSGSLLDRYSGAAWPYLDSFTTWSSVLCTYMVTRKILENWLYWIVIDSVALCLYIERELYLTALLFFVYAVLAIFGYLKWRKQCPAILSRSCAVVT